MSSEPEYEDAVIALVVMMEVVESCGDGAKKERVKSEA